MMLDVATAPRAAANPFKQTRMSWDEFVAWLDLENPASRKDCGNFVGGLLQDGLRYRDTVISRSIVALDADKAAPSFITDTLVGLLGTAVVIYTTWSHTAEAPRYRVATPLNRTVTADEYSRIVDALMADLGAEQFDVGSRQASRLMHRPSAKNGGYEYRVVDGEPLDADYWLARATELAIPVQVSREIDLDNIEPLDWSDALDLLEMIYRKMAETPPGEKNTALNDRWAFMAGGVFVRIPEDERTGVFSEDFIKQRLHEAVGDDPTPEKTKDTIARAFEAGMMVPLVDRKRYDGLFDAHPRLQYIRKVAYSRGMSAPVVLTALMAEIALRIPNHVVLPARVGTEQVLNMGFALMGESGAAKSSAISVARELLGVVENDDWYGGAGSAEGLIDAFHRRVQVGVHESNGKPKYEIMQAEPWDCRFMMVIDEAEELKKVKDGSKLPSYFRTAIGGGGTLSNTNTLTGGNKRRVRAKEYRLVVVIGVHPDQADIVLEDYVNGFPQRFLWVYADDPDLPEWVDDLPVVDRIEPLGVEIPEFEPQDLMTSDLYVVSYPESIARELKQRNLDRAHGKVHRLETHLGLVQSKTALLFSVLLGNGTDISEFEMSLAKIMADESIAAQHMANARMTSNKNDGFVSKKKHEVEADVEVLSSRVAKCADKVVEKVKEHPGKKFAWAEVRPAYRVRMGLDTADILEEAGSRPGMHVAAGKNNSFQIWYEED